jgi:pimeloyl-[acyl-carrier protein] methyl ester esterase
MQIELILQHGWGYQALNWSGFKGQLLSTGFDIGVHTPDRGYFGEPKEAAFSGNPGYKAIVCHSLGLHMLPANAIEEANAVIIVGGFLFFHGGDELTVRRSQKLVRRMKDKLKRNPLELLQEFYVRSFEPCSFSDILLPDETLGALDVEMLREDLDLLDTNILDPASLYGKPVVIMQGSGDKIVYGDACGDLHQELPMSEIIHVENAGHGLPFTHGDLIWLTLRELYRTSLWRQTQATRGAIAR